jgi:hypothetical protein
MDGHRLTSVTDQGKAYIFEFDGTNGQVLVPTLGGSLPQFDRDYKYLYALAPSTTAGQFELTRTNLRTPADQ